MLTKRDHIWPSKGNILIALPYDFFAIIDKEDEARITPYHWYIRHRNGVAYAYRKKIVNGREFRVWMHRQIMHCPNNMVVHHINHNGLDNRKANLLLMTPEQHREIHRFN